VSVVVLLVLAFVLLCFGFMILIAAASRFVLMWGRIVFLNHLDAGAAVLGDLVDVRALHQAQADVSMPQAIGSSRPSVSVQLEILFVENRIEKFTMGFREDQVGRFG